MRSRIIAAALVTAAGAAALPAQTIDRDVRCLMVSNVFAQAEKDAKKKQLALASSFFFMGRIDGRLQPSQLKTQLQAQARTLNNKTIGQTMDGCAKIVQASQRTLVATGQQLDQQAKKR
ncbi:hypothetical protein [Sphingomonas sp.]|uniref:hypothetical protein n=1 Tax=Sphingomonas sp. TaxID=28214 RepID=UPI003B3A984E